MVNKTKNFKKKHTEYEQKNRRILLIKKCCVVDCLGQIKKNIKTIQSNNKNISLK